MANLIFGTDEESVTIEESGGFGQNGETTSGLDAGAKDELNLAEFPIAALTDRVPDGQLTLVFEDKLERRDSEPIIRRLTIMATPKLGLPTPLDDEVMVGLIQLTKRRSNFTDPRVTFSRYELIELLGWPRSGHSYRRIEEALHRWVGVVLMYENAWWDNGAKSWVDESFHVLDNVTLYDRERRKPAKAAKAGAKPTPRKPRKIGPGGDPLSSFKWNEIIFRSFQSGNLKQLDLDFYLKLSLPTTKRMFRFLDKRFYRRSQLDFDLRVLACEHIGLSRSYAPTELKRRLRPALEELEKHGFLAPLGAEERYSRVARGAWRIILIRGDGDRDEQAGPAPAAEASELVAALRTRGVTAKTADQIVAAHPHSRIRTKLEVFDWLVKNEDKRVGKNAAGYLVASIRSDYQAPTDYDVAAARVKSAGKAAAVSKEADAAEVARRRKADLEAGKAKAREAALRARWDELPAPERDAIVASVKAQNPGLSRFRAMIEPLYLAALERRLEAGTLGGQKTLFPDGV